MSAVRSHKNPVMAPFAVIGNLGGDRGNESFIMLYVQWEGERLKVVVGVVKIKIICLM